MEGKSHYITMNLFIFFDNKKVNSKDSESNPKYVICNYCKRKGILRANKNGMIKD